jgi:hypothetical protein
VHCPRSQDPKLVAGLVGDVGAIFNASRALWMVGFRPQRIPTDSVRSSAAAGLLGCGPDISADPTLSLAGTRATWLLNTLRETLICGHPAGTSDEGTRLGRGLRQVGRSPPWGIRFPRTIQLAVHAVVRGRAWLWTQHGGDPLELAPGDLALVRGGPDHFVAHAPGARCVLPGEFRSLSADDADLSAPGSAVSLCGPYRFAGDIGRGLVAALPPVLSLPASVDDPIHQVVTLLSREMLLAEPGKRLEKLLLRHEALLLSDGGERPSISLPS